MKSRDLTGQEFGRLRVLELHPEPYVSPRGVRHRRWICECAVDLGGCGKKLCVNQPTLVWKVVENRSCGCWKRERMALIGKSNHRRGVTGAHHLTGQVFGRLRVLERAGSSSSYITWLCLCDPILGGCGGTAEVSGAELRKEPGTRSCGCLRVETCREMGHRQGVDPDAAA